MSVPNTPSNIKNCWLDCDPGHDDAIALLLALFLKESVNLIGVSTVSIPSVDGLKRWSAYHPQVNGNAPLLKTHVNASQLLALYRAPKSIPLHRGL